MLRLYRYKGGRFHPYTPSAQTHCDARDVEQWIRFSARADGAIADVSVMLHGTSVPVSDAAEACVVAALFVADHNDYVTRNLCFAADTPESADGGADDATDSGEESDVDASVERCKLEHDFEQNETLTVNDFGPSHAENTDW